MMLAHCVCINTFSAYEKGQMSVSQRRGVITLLPKEDSSLLYLKNWRPITLLNVDYKNSVESHS